MSIPAYITTIRHKIGHDLLIMPGVAAFIRDDKGQVLLQRRTDNGQWTLPGGVIEPGEEPADAVVREVWEETGLTVIPQRIIGVYGGPDWHHFYPNQDEVQLISILFACQIIDGELTITNDNESLEVAFFTPSVMPITIMAHHRIYLEEALKDNVTTHFRYRANGKGVPSA